MNHPKVSVAIRCYQHGEYIAQAVKSVLAQQTAWPIEIVIADDASSDGSRTTLEELATEHDSIRLILHDTSIGATKNLAALYAACTGEYVAFLDGDAYWTSVEKLCRQIKTLEEHPNWSLCFHQIEKVDERGRTLGIISPEQVPAAYSFQELLQTNVIQSCSLVIRRACLPHWPEPISHTILGEWSLCLLLAERGDLGFLPAVMAADRVHIGKMWTGGSDLERDLDVVGMFLALQDMIQTEHVPLVRRAITDRFRRSLVLSEQIWASGQNAQPIIDILEKSQQRVIELEQSASWRITAPLRAAVDFWRCLWQRVC